MAELELTFEPDYAVPPAGTLRDTLGALGLSQSDLAARTGLSLKHVNQIAQGLAPISPETAILLEKVTSVPAKMWTLLEATYRAALARAADRETLASQVDWLQQVPVAELIRRGFVDRDADPPRRVEQLCKFFGVADHARWEQVWLAPLASFRQSPSFASDAGAVATWLRLGELEAATIDCALFNARRFKAALATVRSLTLVEPEESGDAVIEECANAGVAVVFVPEIGNTRASGAARWLTPTKAVIQLSLRYKSDDHLWFSFFHEAGHLLLHSKKQTFVTIGQDTDRMEEQANAFAANHLIPKKYEPELATLGTDDDVLEFAQRLGIAPGIVVGRLQKQELWSWRRGNHLKRRLELVDRD